MREKRLFLDCRGESIEPGGLPFASLCLAQGVFETILFVGGRPVFAREHEERLAASASALSIAGREHITAIMRSAAEFAYHAGDARARVRVSVFAGSSADKPSAVVSLSHAPAPPSSVRLGISGVTRYTKDPLAVHKTAAWFSNVVVASQAERGGRYDDIVLDSDGNVAETSKANIFLVVGHEIVTPSLGCILPGVVRGWVLGEARRRGIEVIEKRFPSAALAQCDAAFITNSIIGLLPVSEIEGRTLTTVRDLGWFESLNEAYSGVLAAVAQSGASHM